MSRFAYPRKPVAGDAIAVLSPSSRLAGRFPRPLELGLRRLREDFGLEPVEYPTTRSETASPAERARDIHAAFTDPAIRAVLTTIGGDDQLKVLAHLDGESLAADPKPLFGFSDNTNLHLFMWRLGLVSYHGGHVMGVLGRPGAMHPITRESVRRALFERGTFALEPSADYCDEDRDWDDPETFAAEPTTEPSEGWSWHGARRVLSGPGWGGCLEIVDFQLRTGRYLVADQHYDGVVAFFETSEELPGAEYVYRLLMCMGERGLLSRFGAILWGRPKAWSFEHPNGAEDKRRYIAAQRDAVLRALQEYAPDLPLVWGVELGHTDPQQIVPSGGEIEVDAVARKIHVTY